MKMIKFLVLALLSFSVLAEDFGIAVPDQIKKDLLSPNKGADSPHTQGDRDGQFKKLDSDAPRLPGMTSEKKQKVSWKAKVLGNTSIAPYEFENRPSQISGGHKNLFKKIYDKGNSSFGFSYVRDSYDVSDSRDIFQSTFERSSDSVRGGTLHFEFDKNFYKGVIDINYGVGVGIGLSQGKGSFASSANEESSATFSLYTLPLDFRIGIDILENQYFKVSFSGGPSVMGLYQSRDDKDSGDFGKRLRQYSFGYFGQAKLKVSLAAFSEKIISDNFAIRDVTNMYLDLQMRIQNFDSFQDELTINGSSFGIGFSFDYL